MIRSPIRRVSRILCVGFGMLMLAEYAHAGMPETIERVKPSIVAVGTYSTTRNPNFVIRGTGFVVGDGRLVATNAHVLPDILESESRESLVVLVSSGFADPTQRGAKVIALDKPHDLALLLLEGAPLPALSIRDSFNVREGQTYAFTGFPIGHALGFAPVTHRGMISAVTPIALPGANSEQLTEKLIQRLRQGSFPVFQLDATAYPGSSGSPVFDIETGEVVAVINMVFVKGSKEAALSQPSGITFAMPSKYLQELLRASR